MARPATLTAAFWLWVLTAIIGVVVGIVTMTVGYSSPAYLDLDETARGIAGGVLIAFLIGAIVGGILHVLFAYLMLKPRNWARIVLTVLAVLSIVATVIQGGNAGWLAWAGAAVALVALILQFLPASNAFFRRPAVG